MPSEARKAAEQELERLQQTPPAAAEYAVGRNYLDWILSMPWENPRGQAGLKAAEKIFERATFRPGESQGSAARIHRCHQTPQANQRTDSLPGRPARVAKLPRPKAWRTHSDASSPRISLGGMRDEAEIRESPAHHMSARCRDGSSRRCAAVESRKPGHFAGRIGQGRRGFFAAIRGGLWRCSNPAQTTRLPDHYPRPALRPFAGALHHHGELAGADNIPRNATNGSRSLNCPATRVRELQIAKRYLVPAPD